MPMSRMKSQHEKTTYYDWKEKQQVIVFSGDRSKIIYECVRIVSCPCPVRVIIKIKNTIFHITFALQIFFQHCYQTPHASQLKETNKNWTRKD